MAQTAADPTDNVSPRGRSGTLLGSLWRVKGRVTQLGPVPDAAGALRVLKKPINPAELRSAITRALWR